MTGIYLVKSDGRLFGLPPKGSKIKEFPYIGLDSSITGRRLSAAAKFIWAVGDTGCVYVCIHSLEAPIRFKEETYENQRLKDGHFTDRLLPTERPSFSNEEGTRQRSFECVRLPSTAWEWEEEWTLEQVQNSQDSWVYAHDFGGPYTTEKQDNSAVRRRKWVRNRKYAFTDTWYTIPHLFQSLDLDPFIDVSVGGHLGEENEDFLYQVWAVTSKGKVFWRKDVSLTRPEGSEWIDIPLPFDCFPLGVSCGSANSLWVVLQSGDVLVRKGLSSSFPIGSGWMKIKRPNDASHLFQISVGKKMIWAVTSDKKVWCRKISNVEDGEEQPWEFVSEDATVVSLTSEDEVFCISGDQKFLYWRAGITEAEPAGRFWAKINVTDQMLRTHNKDSQRLMADRWTWLNCGALSFDSNAPPSWLPKSRIIKCKFSFADDSYEECLVEMNWDTNPPLSGRLNVLSIEGTTVRWHMSIDDLRGCRSLSSNKLELSVSIGESKEEMQCVYFEFTGADECQEWKGLISDVTMAFSNLQIQSPMETECIFEPDQFQSHSRLSDIPYSEEISCEGTPWDHDLRNGFSIGSTLTVCGTVHKHATSFQVKLGCEKNDTIALEFMPNFEECTISRNALIDGKWGMRESDGPFNIHPGDDWVLLILCEREGFKLFFNRQKFGFFRHRINPENINIFVVMGDTTVHTAVYECQENYQSLLNWNFLEDRSWKGLETPWDYEFLEGFPPGSIAIFNGCTAYYSDRFHINLKCGNDENVALHVNPRFDEKLIVLNSLIDNSWGDEERSIRMPVTVGEEWEVLIACIYDGFRIFVNGVHFWFYKHRLNPSMITSVRVAGSTHFSGFRYGRQSLKRPPSD